MKRVVLFSKRPIRGRVKTRMVPPLDADQALALHRAFLSDQVALLRALRARYDVELRVDGPWRPGTADPDLGGVRVREQGPGDLGRRLLRAFRGAARQGVETTVVLGADAPTLPAARIHEAFETLDGGSSGVVVPATDGGYVLLGLRRAEPALFDDVAWGGPTVLDETVRRAADAGIDLVTLAPWYDVDDAAGLERLREDLATADGKARAPATATLLARLDLRNGTVL